MSGSLEKGNRTPFNITPLKRYFPNSSSFEVKTGSDFVPVPPQINLNEASSNDLKKIVSNLDEFLESLIKESQEIDKIPEQVEDRQLERYVPAANTDRVAELFNNGLVPGKLGDSINRLAFGQIIQIRSLLRLRNIKWNVELAGQLYQDINKKLITFPEVPDLSKEAS